MKSATAPRCTSLTEVNRPAGPAPSEFSDRDPNGSIRVRSHWFEAMADHLGEAYLRYSFTKGTDQEVAFLIETLALQPGMRVLDVGCGPGRHAHALAK